MYCRNCGKMIPSGSRFCVYCGRPVEEIPKEEPRRKRKQMRPVYREDRRQKKPYRGEKTHKGVAAVLIAGIILSLLTMVGTLMYMDVLPTPSFLTGLFGEKETEQENGSSMHTLGKEFTDQKITDVNSAIDAAQKAARSLGYSNALDELQEMNTTSTGEEKYYRLQQYYQGIPVYGRYVTVIASDAGEARGLTSDLQDLPKKLSLTPEVSREQVDASIRSYAQEHWDALYYDMTFSDLTEDRLVIYDQEEEQDAALAYELTVQNGRTYTVVVDAKTGEILEALDDVNYLTATGYSADGTRDFPVSYDETTQQYEILDEEKQILLMNLNGGSSRTAEINNAVAIYSEDVFFGNTEEEQSLDVDTGILLYMSIQSITDYFYNTFSQGTPFGGMRVYYNDGYQNASANVVETGGSRGGVLTFSSAFDGTEEQVIAHEFSHLITRENHSAHGSGTDMGIEEGLADVFACFYSGSWDINLEGLIENGRHRDASNPGAYGYPSKVTDGYWPWSPDSRFHYYATAISRAAYLMSQSGQISSEKLEQLWYRTMLTLPYNCKYADLLELMLDTADRMDFTEEQSQAVEDAFREVDIVLDYDLKTGNTVHLNIYDRYKTVSEDENDSESVMQDNFYDDYRIRVVGRKTSGLFGLFHSDYSQEYRPEDDIDPETQTFDLHLDNGTYTLYIIDNGNYETKKRMRLYVNGTHEDGEISIYNLGAEYTVAPGAAVTIYDKEGNPMSTCTAIAFDKDNNVHGVDLSQGQIPLSEGNYYRMLVSHEYEPGNRTEYYMTTVRVKAGAAATLDLYTKFTPDEQEYSYYEFIRDELVPTRGYASLEMSERNLDGQSALSNWGWDQRSGLVGADIVDLNQDQVDDLLVYTIGTWDGSTEDEYQRRTGQAGDPTTLYLMVELYSRNENKEIIRVGVQRIDRLLAVEENYCAGGIAAVGGKSYFYYEYMTNAYFADGAYVCYDFFEYDANGQFTLKWSVKKSDGGSSGIAHSLFSRTDQGMEKLVLDASDTAFYSYMDSMTPILTPEGTAPEVSLPMGFERIGLPAAGSNLQRQGVTCIYYQLCPSYLNDNGIVKASFKYLCLGDRLEVGRHMRVTLQDFTDLQGNIARLA